MPSPVPITPTKVAPSTPTGSWRHPAIDIVAKRNSEQAFTDVSFKRLTQNSAAIVFSFFMHNFVGRSDFLVALIPSSPIIQTYFNYALWACRIILFYNVLEALYRLLKPVDEFTDIPLTPEQRKLLGLNPNAPLSAYAATGNIITPPRYTKSTPSSRTGSPSLGASSVGSPTLQRKAVMQIPTPTTPSPLRMPGGLERRHSGGSFGSPGSGLFSGGSSGPKVGGASIIPGNRWVYEKNLQRKNEGLRFSPSKSVLNSPRA